jgi:ABC-type multidrug transport system fused ATPase/permease subunit
MLILKCYHYIRRYNIRYGRVDASDGEVEDAANAADIHERVLSFTKRKLIVDRFFLHILQI